MSSEIRATTSTTLALADFAATSKEIADPLMAANEEATTSALRATSEEEVRSAFIPHAAAIKTFNEKALRAQWPEPARTSIRALIDANNDWNATTKLSASMSLQSVVAKGIEAQGTIKSATSMVKADLGVL